ncbi:MAG: hexokinase [Candidatus Omnitrophica bacterium]|nr:hexokinase [Candidatus Omnitrophota bacterium]
MVEKSFRISPETINKIIKDFHSEMSAGLSGRKSSLAMIPTFASMPTGSETGRFIALDLGGTNFRILEITLGGRGRISIPAQHRFRLKTRDITGTQKQLFGFIAASLKRFMLANKIGAGEKILLGFTFSFPVRQTNISNGILLSWNKGFSAKNTVGKDVVQLVNKALKRKGLHNIKIAALINDTIGTLVTKRYSDPGCDLGVILGTGTNAAYPEKKMGEMAINIEWGNFNRLPRTIYDRKMDATTPNPGRQTLEKMVSGMYLGELARLIFSDMTNKKILKPWEFTTTHLSLAESDISRRLGGIARLLKGLGAPSLTYADRLLMKRICGMVSARSAQISAAAIVAVILRIDPGLKRGHTVAIDGSLFEKWPKYRSHIKSSLVAILKEKARKISLALTQDGSGKGAAVVAATASNS